MVVDSSWPRFEGGESARSFPWCAPALSLHRLGVLLSMTLVPNIVKRVLWRRRGWGEGRTTCTLLLFSHSHRRRISKREGVEAGLGERRFWGGRRLPPCDDDDDDDDDGRGGGWGRTEEEKGEGHDDDDSAIR